MGKAIVVQDDGNDFALIYEGTTTSLAYKSFEILKEKGYKGMLLNIFSIKPIDSELINEVASTVKGIVTLENHSILGGLGGGIAEIIAQKSIHAPISYVGVEDVFNESGKATDVKSKYGLNIENIVKKVEEIIK